MTGATVASRPDWTPLRDKALVRLIEDGSSFSVVSEILGVPTYTAENRYHRMKDRIDCRGHSDSPSSEAWYDMSQVQRGRVVQDYWNNHGLGGPEIAKCLGVNTNNIRQLVYTLRKKGWYFAERRTPEAIDQAEATKLLKASSA